MQITNNNNTSPTFGAKLIFVDKGKCFSLKQKFQLKQLAKKIGDNSDRFYIGTRKYDDVGIYNSDLHFWRKDMQILSSVKGVNREHCLQHKVVQHCVEKETSTYFYEMPKKEQWKIFDAKMFEYLKKFLTDFKEPASKNAKFDEKARTETYKAFKEDVSEFTSFKRNYHKKTLKEKITEYIKELNAGKQKETEAKPKNTTSTYTANHYDESDPDDVGYYA